MPCDGQVARFPSRSIYRPARAAQITSLVMRKNAELRQFLSSITSSEDRWLSRRKAFAACTDFGRIGQHAAHNTLVTFPI
jgi:hypothetical protein